MAMPTTTPPAPTEWLVPTPTTIGNAFVEQYYRILHVSPELVFRFYTDSSVLSRPDSSGEMKSATSMQAINDMILSLDYKEHTAEIQTIDSQESYKDGVMVLVTGCLAKKDNLRRKFTQSFFLAPQEKGYFVFNDVFRYVDDNESLEAYPVEANGIPESATNVPITSDPEPTHVSDRAVMEPVTSLVEGNLDNGGEEVREQSDNGEGSVVDVEVVAELPAQLRQNEARPAESASQSAASAIAEDAPKKSYASIVKVAKGRPVPATPIQRKTPTAIYVPTNSPKVAPANSEQQSAPAPGPEESSPSNDNVPESNNHVEVEGHSIYIRNLPINAMVKEVEDEFKKFGPIKPGGVQVRNNRQQGYCFGFVEFEDLSSMQSAIEAKSISMKGRPDRPVYIEQKKTTSRGGRGRYPQGRGGLQNDNFRGGRGNFNSGRGYGRNDYGYRSEYSGRGRGPSGRGGEGYQRVNQSGSGRGVRQGGVNQATVSV